MLSYHTGRMYEKLDTNKSIRKQEAGTITADGESGSNTGLRHLQHGTSEGNVSQAIHVNLYHPGLFCFIEILWSANLSPWDISHCSLPLRLSGLCVTAWLKVKGGMAAGCPQSSFQME